jgi:esterase/lipase superfamily enzyme
MIRLNLRKGDSTLRFGRPEWGAWDPVSCCTGRRVLALIHGYRVAHAYDAYREIARNIGDLYDVIVGVSWPGSRPLLGFWWACQRSGKAGELLAAALRPLQAASIDLEGHSLGCRVALETVRCGLPVRDVILAAPAVDDESIEIGERYGERLAACRRVVVGYSSHDEALAYGYRMLRWDKALGLHGPRRNAWLPDCVRAVDCAADVADHGDYKRSATFYAAWRSI